MFHIEDFRIDDIYDEGNYEAIVSSGRQSIYVPNELFDKIVGYLPANFTCEDAEHFDYITIHIHTENTKSQFTPMSEKLA